MTRRTDLAIAQDVGERMRAMRVAVFGEKSETHVAALMGVSQSEISRWERGERVFTVAQAVRFARACGRDATRLFSGVAPALAEQELLPLSGIEPHAADLVRDLVDMLRTLDAARAPRRRGQAAVALDAP